MKRQKPKKRDRSEGRDGPRAVLAALLLLFVLVAHVSDGKPFLGFSLGGSSAALTPGEPDDDLKTGSILIVPSSGDLCRHRLIDNATWRIKDNGVIACDQAAARTTGRQNAASRIEAVRDGFFSKK